MNQQNEIVLPEWSVVSPRRLDHIRRVVRLLEQWARKLRLDESTAREWSDAGLFHDALRDADPDQLRKIVPESDLPAVMLHGPAAARLLEREGERRGGLIEAVRFHTTAAPDWGETGRALYCADFLEPGRAFEPALRAELAARFPGDPATVYKDVLRMRMNWSLQRDDRIHHLTLEAWNSLH